MLKLFNSAKRNANKAIAQAVKSLSQYGIGKIDCVSNDIVFTSSLRSQALAIKAIAHCICEESSVVLKGLSEPVTVFRIKNP